MATRKTKIVWTAADGTEHDSEHSADHWDRYSAIREALETADMDWRDGNARPDTVAALLAVGFGPLQWPREGKA